MPSDNRLMCVWTPAGAQAPSRQRYYGDKPSSPSEINSEPNGLARLHSRAPMATGSHGVSIFLRGRGKSVPSLEHSSDTLLLEGHAWLRNTP